MEFSDIQNTARAFNKTGVGADAIGNSIDLFHQLPCKIVAHNVAVSGQHSGKYFIEGDVTGFISGYTQFWVEGRTFDEDNLITVSSATYDVDSLWTEVVISESATYKANVNDIGHYICGKFNLTNSDKIKSIGNVVSEMNEEGSLANMVADTFDFEINNEDKAYYNRAGRSGHFYAKDILTEITSVQSESKFSYKSGIYTTFIMVRDLFEFNASHFIYGFVEFVTGKAAGNVYTIVGSNGYSFKLVAYLSKNYSDINNYHIDVQPGDKVRIYNAPVFWVKYDVWARAAIDERMTLFSGKIDLESVQPDDIYRSVKVKAYSISKDFFNKNINDVKFDNGMNAIRLKEVKMINVEAFSKKAFKLTREDHPEYPMESVKVEEVGFDVGEGWHFLDFCPDGLFRFDFGKWHHITDEGSFEKSTDSVFLLAQEQIVASAVNVFDYPAVLPDHSTDSTENALIERKWHGGWCRISIATEEAEFIGAVNRMSTNDGNQFFKKLAGLPSSPCRVAFYVNEDRTIRSSNMFLYSFDSGELMLPSLFFDHIQEINPDTSDSRDVTNLLNFGRHLQTQFYDTSNQHTYSFPWEYDLVSAQQVLRIGNFYKFNGIMLWFRNENWEADDTNLYCSTYGSFMASFLQNMQMRFSNGSDHQNNIVVRFISGYAKANGTTSSLILSTVKSMGRDGGSLVGAWDAADQGAVVGMKIMCISANNFLEIKKILTVADNGDSEGKELSLTTEAFTNAVLSQDRFVIINKNFDIKMVDNGDAFKDGEHPDVLAVYRPRSVSAGNYYTDIKSYYYTDAMYYETIKPLNKLYIGHRSKFSALSISVSMLNALNDDTHDVAWYLKKSDFMLEYFNGTEWVPANNVAAVPTTVVGVRDNTTLIQDRDDLVKYKIIFDADDWYTGGYDSTEYATSDSQAPSDIDEDNIYCVRLTFLNNNVVYLSNVSLSSISDLNLAVCWSDIPGWAKTTLEIADGKYIVDTMTAAPVTLDLFSIELMCRGSLSWLRQVKPISKAIGYNGDELYFTVDANEVDSDIVEDIITVDDKNKISTVPKNINYISMLKKILEDNGYKDNKNFDLHLDDFSNFDKSFLNVVGSKFDGAFPIDVGWDKALCPEVLSDYGVLNNGGVDVDYRHVCAIRANGRYFAFGIAADKVNYSLMTSTDMKSWTTLVTVSTGGQKWLSMTVIKNRDDGYFSVYTSRYIDSRYKICVSRVADLTAGSLADIVSTYDVIVDDANYNYGDLDVMHLKGLSGDATGIKLMCVVQYSTTAVDGSDNPTGDPYLYFFLNEGAIDTAADWDKTFGGDPLAGALGTNPNFVAGSFSKNDGTYDESRNLHNFSLIFKGTDNKLYETKPKIEEPITTVWEYPNLVEDLVVDLLGFSVIKDAYIYNLVSSASRDAYVLVPTFNECNLLIGVTSTVADTFTCIAMNRTCDGVATDLFWRDRTSEMNEVDWFKTNFDSAIAIDDAVSTNGKHHRVYLGFRSPFNKILSKFSSLKYSDRVMVKYWDGISWNPIPTIYQNGRTITTGKVNPIFGFYFNEPVNWVADVFNNIVGGYTYGGLEQYTPSLYWVEISLPAGYASNKRIDIKAIKLCYTALWAWSGRSLYLMNNWDYFRHIYTFNAESHINIKIDSISYDKSDKLVLVNTAEDNPYDYSSGETYVFDVMGRFKTSYPIWTTNFSLGHDEFKFITEKPSTLIRDFREISVEVEGIDLYLWVSGQWDWDFIKKVYAATDTSTNYETLCYNTPVPREQLIRKYSPRNSSWEMSDGYFNYNIINNIWVSKRNGISHLPVYSDVTRYQNTSLYSYNIASLTNSGLLFEELVNGPHRKVPVGYYAFLEKNYLTRYMQLTVDINGFIGAGGSLPATPGDGDIYVIAPDADDVVLIANKNTIAQYVDVIVGWKFTQPYSWMLVKDTSDSDAVYQWIGYKWNPLDDTIIWPGRNAGTVTYNYPSLEYSVGSEGVNIAYFRDWNNKPDRFIGGNTSNFYDKKRIVSYRDIERMMITGLSFGGRKNYDSRIPRWIKVTSAVELPDLSAMKDSLGDDSTLLNEVTNFSAASDASSMRLHVVEPSAPAIAFGAYGLYDNQVSATRDDGVTTLSSNPYAYSGICLSKPCGKVKNWLKAFHWNGSAYSDITNEMNNKKYNTTNYIIRAGATPQYIYLASQTRFFDIAISLVDIATGQLNLEYLNRDGTWDGLGYNGVALDYLDTKAINDYYDFKTKSLSLQFSPFIGSWCQMPLNGVTGYWVRVKNTQDVERKIRWAVLSGTMLWDNINWWDDYDITSDLAPVVSPTDDQKRYFDTFIPMSMDYDTISKKIIGSFWNFDAAVNKYYPFKISFDVDQLFNGDEFYWSWDNQEAITIIDKAGLDYTLNIKSIASVSSIDCKAILCDEANKDKSPIIANIKSLSSGDKLFNFSIE